MIFSFSVTPPEILARTGQHLVLVGVALTIATAIAIPLGIFASRHPRFGRWVIGFSSVMQTIPSIALLGFLISVPLLGGIGVVPTVVALVLYSLLPIVRNTYTGIVGIDPAIREAAIGMGMTDLQLLVRVELPLAASVILAGVRVATVIGVGVAAIAAEIGAGGLGVLIFRGIFTVNNQLIMAGALPAACIALLADFGLGQLAKRWEIENRAETQ